MSRPPGRHCVICGRPGGSGMAVALRSIQEEAQARGIDLGWASQEVYDGKAHGPCVIRTKRNFCKESEGDD